MVFRLPQGEVYSRDAVLRSQAALRGPGAGSVGATEALGVGHMATSAEAISRCWADISGIMLRYSHAIAYDATL